MQGTKLAISITKQAYCYCRVKTRLQVQVQQHERNNGGKKDGDNKADRRKMQDGQYTGAVDAIQKILRQDGISGLYTGLESSIAGTASMNFAYFYWSAAARSAYQQGLQYYGIEDFNSIVKEFGLGAAGGALAQLCTTPIAVIATRQQTCKAEDCKQSMWETMMEIVQSEDGWSGLWRGFKVNLILVINPMITYGVYQWLRGGLVGLKKQLGSVDAFCSCSIPSCKNAANANNFYWGLVLGALSKVLATIATHPLIVAKAMLQSKPPPQRNGVPFRGFTEVLLYIMKNEGIRRLYKGLIPQIVKGFMVQGLMMMLKERLVFSFVRLYRSLRY